MNNEIGFALVSQVHATARERCAKCPPGRWCSYPKPPRCNAACVHAPKLLAKHPECQRYERDVDDFYKRHPDITGPNGRTNVSPVHYFRDCKGLKPRQQGHGRVVGLDAGTIEALGLPVCERCVERMAPLEREMAGDRILQVDRYDGRESKSSYANRIRKQFEQAIEEEIARARHER